MKTNTPKQRAKGRAQPVFLNTYAVGNRCFPRGHIAVHLSESKARELRSVSRGSKTAIPAAIIRLDEYAATVERMARAIYGEQHDSTRWQKVPYSHQMFHLQAARSALASIGIAAPKGRARK